MRGSDARTHMVTNNSASSLTRNQNTGTSHVLTKPLLVPMPGPDGPPRNSVTAIADIVMTFMNSARKKIANRIPEYSVWNPPTSSCSASTRSNGGWFVSATAAITKITNETMATLQYQSVTNECQLVHAWAFAMPRVLRVPACNSTATIERPNAAS